MKRLNQPFSWQQLAWVVLLFVVLPNALFLGVTELFGMGRPWVNLDYLAAAVVFALGWRWVGVGLAALFFVVEVLHLTHQVYRFLRLSDVVYLLGLLPQASVFMQVLALVVVAAFFLFLWLLFRFSRRTALLPALLVLNIGLLFYGLDMYRKPLAEMGVDVSWAKRWVRSQGLYVLQYRTGGFADTFAMTGEPFHDTGYVGQTGQWAAMPAEHLNPKILLIVAESWGSFQHEALNDSLLSPVHDVQQGFDWIHRGEMPFLGATVAAELRELCGLWPNHFNLKPVEHGFEDCLPWRFKSAGYVTEAVHGAGGLMYDRVFWYPRLGFDQWHFRETRRWQSRCYSFPGVCDREIADTYIKSAFANSDKRFVYWLTLNSHAIYDRRDIRERLLDCTVYGIPSASETCRMAQLHAQFFHDLAAIVSDPAMAGVEVLVVGDHAPPLLNADERERHVKDKTVSWVHFRIKDTDENGTLSMP